MNARREINLTINGMHYCQTVEARRTLVDVIREDCGLTGTHIGCEHGVCGACTILLDGEPIRSCLMFAVQAHRRSLRTVEGLQRVSICTRYKRRSYAITVCNVASAHQAF